MSSNAERIVLALDRHLDHEVPLVIYGRAALALGYPAAPEDVKRSLDLDAIIPTARVAQFQNDLKFWDAQEAANRDLEKDGLYVTHLFDSSQVFLRPDWEQHLVPIHIPPTRWLRLSRPATVDLVLTKMMRGDDAQDLADVEFLLRQERIDLAEMEEAFGRAVIPDLPELREAFEKAKPAVRERFRRSAES